jgi:hypothetical protein
MKHLPTDFEILDEMYKRYYHAFSSFSREEPTRSAKILVPIDIKSIADHLRVDGDTIFGRLYYHLNEKYSYEQSDGSKVRFFCLQAGSDRHCVQFPVLASVLAQLRQERTHERRTIWFSVVALAISLVSLIVSISRTAH